MPSWTKRRRRRRRFRKVEGGSFDATRCALVGRARPLDWRDRRCWRASAGRGPASSGPVAARLLIDVRVRPRRGPADAQKGACIVQARRDASRAASFACSARDSVGLDGGGLRDGVLAAPGAWA